MKVFNQLHHKSVYIYPAENVLINFTLFTTKTVTIYINYFDKVEFVQILLNSTGAGVKKY